MLRKINIGWNVSLNGLGGGLRLSIIQDAKDDVLRHKVHMFASLKEGNTLISTLVNVTLNQFIFSVPVLQHLPNATLIHLCECQLQCQLICAYNVHCILVLILTSRIERNTRCVLFAAIAGPSFTCIHTYAYSIKHAHLKTLNRCLYDHRINTPSSNQKKGMSFRFVNA